MGFYARVRDGKVAEAPIEVSARPFTFPGADYSWEPLPEDLFSVVKEGWTFDGTNYAAPVVTPVALTIEQALAALTAYSKSRQSAGITFTPAGASDAINVATDSAGRADIALAFVLAQAELWIGGTPWKTAEGNFVPLVAADVISIAKKAATYIAACVTQEASFAAAIADDTSTDITGGWPAQ